MPLEPLESRTLLSATLVAEDFTSGAGGFAVVDGPWSASGGTYNVVTPDNTAATTALNSRSIHSVVVSGDFTLDFDASAKTSTRPWVNFAAIFDYQDPSNFYFFSSNQSNDAATSGIFKVVNGTSTELADVPEGITPGITYHVRVERAGDQIRAFRDGTLLAAATDSTFLSGKVGLGTRQFQASFDNFAVATASAPAPAVPAAPSGLSASAASQSQVNLRWVDNSTDETGFKVEQSTDGVNFTQVATAGADATTYAATGLAPSTQYAFRVRAAGAAGDSPYSNTASATTTAAAPVISEDFTGGAANFAVVGGPWSPSAGSYNVTANNTAATTTLNSVSVHNQPIAGDFTMDFDARALSATAPWANFAAVFDYQDPQNYYFFSSNQSNDGATSGIFRVANGTSTELADVPQGITPGTTYHVQLVRQGSQISVYRNDALLATATDSTFLSGQVGLGTRQFQASFDNLTVTGAAATVTAPAAPSGLTATATSASQVTLAWADNSTNETGFKVERSIDGTTWAEIATTAANVSTYSATGLSPSTAYQFRVRATNSVGDSAYSNAASATTQDLPTTPAVPSSLSATAASSSQVDLSWVDNSTNETGFKVERSTDGVNFAEIAALAPNVTTYSATALTSGTTYTFRVRAYNAVGNSGYSNTASATTPATPPAAPSGLAATAASASQVNVAWTDNSGDETGFKVEQSTDGTNWTQVGTTGANVTTFAATGLAASTTYQFRVRATNSAGDSGYSNSFSATTQALPTPPAAPSALAATAASASQVNLSWTDNSTDETGFKVERSTDGVNFTQVGTVGANVTSYFATGLAASTQYTFRVRATNAAGDSAYTNAASATTPAATTTAIPDATNTGLAVTGTKESSLRVISGTYTARAGEVLEGINFAGGVIIPAGADNVVIRNCLVSGGHYGVQSMDGARNLLVENTEIRGTSGKGMLIHHATVRRCYIHDVGSDGIFTHVDGDLLIEYNFITRCGKDNPTDHVDGIQVHNPGSNIVVRYNHIVLPSSAYNGGWAGTWGYLNSCIVFQSDWGSITNSSIVGNWLDGGGYTIRLEEKGGYDISGITVSGNRFTHDYDYGPLGTIGSPGFTWTDNAYSDTGQPIL